MYDIEAIQEISRLVARNEINTFSEMLVKELVTIIEKHQKEMELIAEVVTKQKEEIEDLQETVSELVLLTGPTESNNKQNKEA